MEWNRRETWDSPEDQEGEDQNDLGKQQDDGAGATATANRRMYDCSICKRGFTNAQALGGHMNMHRKEKQAKYNLTLSSSSSPSSTAKLQNPNSNPSPPAFQPPPPPPFFPLLESQTPLQGHYNLGGGHAYGGFYGARAEVINPQGNEPIGVDLRLGLGTMNVVDNNRRSPERGGDHPEEGDDLDLELRLGPDR